MNSRETTTAISPERQTIITEHIKNNMQNNFDSLSIYNVLTDLKRDLDPTPGDPVSLFVDNQKMFADIKDTDSLTEEAVLDEFNSNFTKVDPRLRNYLTLGVSQSGYTRSAEYAERAIATQRILANPNDATAIDTTTVRHDFYIQDENSVVLIEQCRVTALKKFPNCHEMKKSDADPFAIGVAIHTIKLEETGKVVHTVEDARLYLLDAGMNVNEAPDVHRRIGVDASIVQNEINTHIERFKFNQAINANPTFKESGKQLLQEIDQLEKAKKISPKDVAETLSIATKMVNDPSHDTTKCVEQYKNLRYRGLALGGLLALTAVALLATSTTIAVLSFGVATPAFLVTVPLAATLATMAVTAALGTGAGLASIGFFATKRSNLTSMLGLINKTEDQRSAPPATPSR